MKVRLVDDHRDTVDVLAAIVSDHGHQPLVAHTGRCALEAAGREIPELTFWTSRSQTWTAFRCVAPCAQRAPQHNRIVALIGFVEYDRSDGPVSFDARLIKPVSFDVFEHFLR
ncbi:MAG TPA: hypothetical protein VF534_11015 [Paraburkholderia sp.]